VQEQKETFLDDLDATNFKHEEAELLKEESKRLRDELAAQREDEVHKSQVDIAKLIAAQLAPLRKEISDLKKKRAVSPSRSNSVPRTEPSKQSARSSRKKQQNAQNKKNKQNPFQALLCGQLCSSQWTRTLWQVCWRTSRGWKRSTTVLSSGAISATGIPHGQTKHPDAHRQGAEGTGIYGQLCSSQSTRRLWQVRWRTSRGRTRSTTMLLSGAISATGIPHGQTSPETS